MHRITNLELLRTLMLCLVQLSKFRECKATDAEKLSQWEKVAKCNFRSNALARPRMLKSFFHSELKLLTAIIKVKLIVHERFYSHEMKCYFAMQKTDFHVLELFCKASHIRASMHRITNLELLRTLLLCLVHKANEENARHGCWKASFSVRKVVKCNFMNKAQLH